MRRQPCICRIESLIIVECQTFTIEILIITIAKSNQDAVSLVTKMRFEGYESKGMKVMIVLQNFKYKYLII